MKEKLIELMNHKDYRPLNRTEIAERLGYVGKDYVEFLDCLKLLEEEGIIFQTKQSQYNLSSALGLKKGVVRLNKKGFAFIDFGEDEEDLYVSKAHLMGAMDHDTVLVSFEHSNHQHEGIIRSILKRSNKQIVGEVYIKQGQFFIQPDDSKILATVIVLNNQFPGLMGGHKVVAEIVEYQDFHHIKVTIKHIIGHRNDPGVDVLSIVEGYGIDYQFSEATLEEASQVGEVLDALDYKGREDLTDLIIVTIDGESAKDLDDAIHLKLLDNGHFEVGVHIADVSHYVKAQSAIDDEAYQRGTSIYLTDRVIPMLPHRLSNGICSLNPNVDRLAISCVFEIDLNGEIYHHRIFPSVIRSKYRMTYENVNLILKGQKKLRQKYEPIITILEQLHMVAKGLEAKRHERGAIDFDIKESKVIVDNKGKAIDIKVNERGESEKIIESLMICANEIVAEHIFWMQLPFIYRVHEAPKVKRLREFMGVASILGYRLKGQIENIHPKDIQNLINRSKNKAEESLIATLLLRTMQKARYSEQNIGHYGLASTHYTHFTSPIRRYPDLIVHRLLRTYLFEGRIDAETIDYYQQKMSEFADSTSQSEQTATACERDVTDMKKAEYMEDKIGQTFNAVISSVLGFGMFVELDNTIEGLIHVSKMRDDHYIFDEKRLSFVGRRHQKRYQIGDQVKVRLVNVDKKEGTIDFILLANNKKKHTIKKRDTRLRRR